MATFKQERASDEPTVITLNVLDMKADEWGTESFRCKRIIPPKTALAMRGINISAVDLETFADVWGMILIPADTVNMRDLLLSDDRGADMGELTEAFKWAMKELGMEIQEVDPDDPSQPPSSGHGRSDTATTSSDG